MSQHQKCPRTLLETNISCLQYQVRFFLAMLWTSRQNTTVEETWVSGSVFSLPQVVRSIDVQYLPHPHRDTSPQSIVLINQSHSEVKLKQMNNRQNLKPDLLGEPKLGLFLQKCHTRGRCVVKLTMRQIRKELRVVDQYHNPTLTLTFCQWTVVESGEG